MTTNGPAGGPLLTPPAAGEWVRAEFDTGPVTRCWHLATGDVQWRRHWHRPQVLTACGYRAWFNSSSDLRRTDDPDVPCHRCLVSSQRPARADGARPPGGSLPPAVIRVLLRYREAVAQATEQAYRDLERAGHHDPAGLLLGRQMLPRATHRRPGRR